MTRQSIEEQVEILRVTTERISSSPEAASEYLQRAGIIHHKGGAVSERSHYASRTGQLSKRSAVTGKFVARKGKK